MQEKYLLRMSAANYKWMVFIHYRRPSRKFSLLSNTMLIWVWLSKVIKLLWIKRFLLLLLFYFFKRQLFPLFSFTYYKEVLSRELLVIPQLPHLLLQWWLRSNIPSEQVMVLTAAANAQCTAHPLCLFPSLFVFPNSSPSALQSHLSSSIYKWEAPLTTSQNFCLCSLPACSRLGGKSDWPSLDQLAAFKLGIKELGTPNLCSHSNFYLRTLNLGEGMSRVFLYIQSIISYLAGDARVQYLLDRASKS